MVTGAIIGIGAVALALFVFREDIGKFFASINPIKPAQEALDKAGNDIFNAGVESRKALDTQILKLNIDAKDSELERQAKQAGFENRKEQALVTDAGSVVIGSKQNVVDFGLIGDVMPTNPSETFLARFGGQTEKGTMITRTFGKRKRFGQ